MLAGAPFRGTILVSHVHWDHVQGLPFFAAGDRAGASVRLVVPAQGGKSGRDLVAQMMSPPAFPITPEGLIGAWTFDAVHPGELEVEGFSVRAFEVAHKGGRTFGYTVRAGRRLDRLRARPRARARRVRRRARTPWPASTCSSTTRSSSSTSGPGPSTTATPPSTTRSASPSGSVPASVALFHHGPHRTDDALDADRARRSRPRCRSSSRPRARRSTCTERPRRWTPRLGRAGRSRRVRVRADPLGLGPALPASRTTTGSSRRPPTSTSSCWRGTSPTS